MHPFLNEKKTNGEKFTLPIAGPTVTKNIVRYEKINLIHSSLI